jgi:hypothetical protein
MAADIEDAFVIAEGGTDGGVAMGFGDVKIAGVINGEGDGILQERFGGEEFGLQAGREAELVDDFDRIADRLRGGRAEVGGLEGSDQNDGEDGEHGAGLYEMTRESQFFWFHGTERYETGKRTETTNPAGRDEWARKLNRRMGGDLFGLKWILGMLNEKLKRENRECRQL